MSKEFRSAVALPLAVLAFPAWCDIQAESSHLGFRVGESFGSKSNITAYVANWRSNLMKPRSLGDNWQWRVDIEYSLGEWRTDVPDGRNYSGGRDESAVASVSPLFHFSAPGYFQGKVQPYIEMGIGAAYFQHKTLAAYDYSEGELGSHLQFEDRVSVGVVFPRYRGLRLSFGIFHYSNANLGDANDGINLRMLSVSIPF